MAISCCTGSTIGIICIVADASTDAFSSSDDFASPDGFSSRLPSRSSSINSLIRDRGPGVFAGRRGAAPVSSGMRAGALGAPYDLGVGASGDSGIGIGARAESGVAIGS